MSLCEYCGTDLEAEEEMFSQDKLYTGHSCNYTEFNLIAKNIKQLLWEHGVPAYLPEEMEPISQELADQIKGRG